MSDRLPIRRILCPTDFSAYSERSLRQAVALARWFGAEVDVLHVVHYVLPAGEGLPYFPAPKSADSSLLCQARDDLAQFVQPVLHEPVVVQMRLREGPPWREIDACARELPADLIVMGTHGRAGFEHLVLGSVTEKLLRRAPCPILTVCHSQRPSAKRQLFRRIVCAADLTADSARTIHFALGVAEENEARVILLHVLPGPFEKAPPRAHGPAPEHPPLRRDLEAFALERLRRAVPDEARDWCAVKERVTTGKPYREILRVAAEEEADLIVMGAHAQGALGRLFFGSSANHVVREAACPVLIVREAVSGSSSRPSIGRAEEIGQDERGPVATEEDPVQHERSGEEAPGEQARAGPGGQG